MATDINLPKLTISLLNIIASTEQLGTPLTYNGLLTGITYMLGAPGAIQLVKGMQEAELIKVEAGLVKITAKGHTFRLTPDILDRLKDE